MVTKKIVALALACLMGGWVMAQSIVINPLPNETRYKGKRIAQPQTFHMVGRDEAAPNAVRALDSLLGGRLDTQGVELVIGEKGDKCVKKYVKYIPNYPEGYYLEVGKKRIVLAGNDIRGTFYAVQTLRQLLNDEAGNKRSEIPLLTITDYPKVHVRGVVEGFYGSPWSQEARISQLEFYGANKLNTYVFGPKNDPYHSTPRWRLPYPEKQAKGITHLVNLAHQNEVDFVWAIHPGRDIQWNDEDRDKVVEKFESMYQLGVRSFAVFFDDISGNGTNARHQAELMNYLNKHFVQKKSDVKPLIICPTEYNRGRCKTDYMATLGSMLDADIRIMWTGDRALSDITVENLEWVQEKMKRKPYIWWNFPVTDFANERILMGRVQGVTPMIEHHTSAFVANPMEYAEASKLSLYGVANLTWNPSAYQADSAWLQAIKALMPTEAAAFKCFCSHSSATGEEHFKREESAHLLPLIERINRQLDKQKSIDEVDVQALDKEFKTMTDASERLLLSTCNLSLIKEIKPWLVSFGLLGKMGEQTLLLHRALQQGNRDDFQQKYRSVRLLQHQVSVLNRKPKVGSEHVLPLIKKIFRALVQQFNLTYKSQLEDTV